MFLDGRTNCVNDARAPRPAPAAGARAAAAHVATKRSRFTHRKYRGGRAARPRPLRSARLAAELDAEARPRRAVGRVARAAAGGSHTLAERIGCARVLPRAVRTERRALLVDDGRDDVL